MTLPPNLTTIYKICDASAWRAAERAGEFAGAPVDLSDGYIHFSAADQVEETAAKHFAGHGRSRQQHKSLTGTPKNFPARLRPYSNRMGRV